MVCLISNTVKPTPNIQRIGRTRTGVMSPIMMLCSYAQAQNSTPIWPCSIVKNPAFLQVKRIF